MDTGTNAWKHDSFKANDSDGDILLIDIDDTTERLVMRHDDVDIYIDPPSPSGVVTLEKADNIALRLRNTGAAADTKDWTLGVDTGTGNLLLRSRADNGSLQATVTITRAGGFQAAGNSSVSGTLGVGTASVDSLGLFTVEGSANSLSVSRTSGATGRAGWVAQNTAETVRLFMEIYGLSSVSTGFGQTLAGWSVIQGTGTGLNGVIIGTGTADPVIIGTNNNQRMLIDATGIVILGSGSAAGSATAGGFRAVGDCQFDGAAMFSTKVVSVNTTAGTYHNWDLENKFYYGISPVGSVVVTGFTGGATGKPHIVANVGGGTLTLNANDAGSSANNQMQTPSSANLVLGPGEAAWMIWSQNLWRVYPMKA